MVTAQPAYNYSKFDFGVAGAVNKPFTDSRSNDYSASGLANVTFNQTPFLNYVGELQAGQLSGNSNYSPSFQQSYRTRYLAPSVRIQLQAGQFINYYNNRFLTALKNLYLSCGLGAIYSRTNITNTIQSVNNTANLFNASNYALFIPARLGYEFKIFNADKEPFIKVDIGYQFNYVFEDRLDGIKSGHSSDGFNQLIIGLKFAVPGIVSYKKPL